MRDDVAANRSSEMMAVDDVLREILCTWCVTHWESTAETRMKIIKQIRSKFFKVYNGIAILPSVVTRNHARFTISETAALVVQIGPPVQFVSVSKQ